ncbi:MAG: dihydropteroate synthase [Oxalicibacterium faecigallinarum]|uniref:dihydropteroate synthase n=1 Tax=Oxalicibacterium faecigallinarum TaxID=573741 RepID=UPI002806C835|nr:dihydropteroate synthase [Oxalicibacterium faecigallinarum]MDQ7970672.1 dihydropteroate synthase [Oxalicibacterium faecigallinarum]
MQKKLQCGRFQFSFEKRRRPLVMGILNVTPDSFSDGGRYGSLDAALSHAEMMIDAGADMIDIGGESSRPGSQPLPLQQELDRVMPLVFALRDLGVPLSIDTYKPVVMRETLAAGADMINDINGFRGEGAWEAVKDSDCGLCIMHMQKDPQSMQQNPEYTDIVAEIRDFLKLQVVQAQQMGIAPERLCIDPGFGFGKTLQHNVTLFQHIGQLQDELALPMLVGVSRKTMIGTLIDKPVEQRMAGSVAAALAAASHGARIVRVHDVAETVDALKVWEALSSAV